jgi:hypothetical protein
MHLDDNGGAVEAHRELKISVSVIDGVGDQFVRDEQDRLGIGLRDAPQVKLLGEPSSGTSGRGQDRGEGPAHLADSW